MQVEEGKNVGIIGPNGAGKTTIFNLISGIYKPDSGSIHLCSEEITGMPQEKIAVRGLGRTFQNIRLFNELSVLDNVRTALGPCLWIWRVGNDAVPAALPEK